jgi:hypothetical protein
MKLLLKIIAEQSRKIHSQPTKNYFQIQNQEREITMQISEFLRRQLNTPLVEGVGAGDAPDLNIISVMFFRFAWLRLACRWQFRWHTSSAPRGTALRVFH